MPKINLESSEGHGFYADVSITKASATIEKMRKALGTDENESAVISLPNVTSAILQKVLAWLAYHKDDPPPTDEPLRSKQHKLLRDPWDQDFFKIDQISLYELIKAAHYLDIKDLYDSSCLAVANLIRGKTTEEIREIMGIQCNNLPEEVIRNTNNSDES